MANNKPKYIDNCPILLPDETYQMFSQIRSAYDNAWAGNKIEAGFGSFKSGYSNPMFNGHNQSATNSTLKNKK